MAAYKWSDPEFVDKIILEVKSQGHFDTFRKECLADVDTQPAYQNLHSRVEDTVQRFLNRQVWTPEIKNKNRLREDMRMNIIRAGFLESGVSRIVDQVVEQKMDYIQSKVEEILYKYVGIEKPIKKEEKQNGTLEIDTALLPTDLEQVSPDSSTDKKSPNSIKEEIEEELAEDEDFESPAFEPIEPMKIERTVNENSENTNLSEISGLTSQDSAKSPKSEPTNIEDRNKVDTALSQISSTQDNIPDTTEMEPPIVPSVLTVPGICGEEAQMATGLNDSTENDVKATEAEKTAEEPKCQFDLKKNPIEFTGTERKSINLDDSTNSGESEKVAQQREVKPMEVENTYENDTTDSSEMRMEIDLKEDTTQGTAMSSKIEESSQDSSKVKDKKHQKRERSRERSKSSSHKSSRHHHSHSSSSKSKNDENNKHKTQSSVHKSSSSHKKSSSEKDRDRSSSSRREHRDKDKKSGSFSKTRPKQATDDHQQEKATRKRRSTDHDSGDSKDVPKSNNTSAKNQGGNKTAEKSTTEQPTNDQQNKVTENKGHSDEQAASQSPNESKEHQKSSIIVKYDYLKSPTENEKMNNDDEELSNGFQGFEADVLPKNPWFECLDMMKSKKFPFVSNNNYINKKNDGSIVSSRKTKQKMVDSADIHNLSNDSEQHVPNQKSQLTTQRYDANDLYKPKFDFSRRRRGQALESDNNKDNETAPASN